MKTTVIIKKNRDFTRMYRRAKTKTSPLLVTYCARNRLGHNRIGITASKRCLLYTSPSPRDRQKSRMPSSA